MKRIVKATALAAGLGALAATGVSADGYHKRGYHHGPVVAGTVQVTISCYRGPWEEVIWDRPEAIFVESLVDAGYDYEEAYAIANRVCRDQSGVGNPEVLRESVRAALLQQPPRHLRVRRGN